MKKVFFALATVVCVYFQGIAQERNFTESINHYININGTSQQYDDAIDQLFVMLKQQYQAKEVPETVWNELKQEKPRALNQIKVMLASAYRSHFEHDDIKELIKFYESSAGRQYKVDPVQLTQEQKDQITFFYDSYTGIKLKNQSRSLNEMVSQISESWSSQLYMGMKDKLADKGYELYASSTVNLAK